MAFVPAPNIIMAEVRYLLDNQHIENRLMINNSAAVDAAALEAMAILVWNWAENDLFPFLNASLRLVEVLTTDLTTVNGGQFTYAPDATTVGSEGGACLPNECAFCVSLRSTSRGRSARGRIYIPAIPVSAMVTQNNLSTTAASNLVSAVNSLVSLLLSGGKPLTIVSYVSNGIPRVGGPVYFEVENAVSTDTIIDSQRRRKPGVGA